MKQPHLPLSLKAWRGKSDSGFTLLEIMMVVIIMGLLMGAAIYAMKPQLEVAKVQKAKGDISSLSTCLMSYEGVAGCLPSTSQGLQALVAEPSGDPKPSTWMQCIDKLPQDPWHNPYQYALPGIHNPKGFDLFTTTPKGQQIGNWDN
jgi:general secretion pathway protein G